MNMAHKRILAAASAVVCISVCGTFVYADIINPEVCDGVYDGYALKSKMIDEFYTCGNQICWDYSKDEEDVYYLESYDIINSELLYGKIKVPDKINNKTMEYIHGSCYLREFDLNPENKYMKCVDNVIFSKDGSELMSYAKYDERAGYIIPEKTETVCGGAFSGCENLSSIVIPDSVCYIGNGAFSRLYNIEAYEFSDNVEVIPRNAFAYNRKLKSFNIKKDSKLRVIREDAFEECPMLSELYLPSFDVSIDRGAFGRLCGQALKTELKSYVQPELYYEENTVKWDKIPKASYYEIYQKLGSGEYKLLGKTKETSHQFNELKSGVNYTIAVKPIAVIPAKKYNKENDEGIYPESFTVEGTMSEDIIVTA